MDENNNFFNPDSFGAKPVPPTDSPGTPIEASAPPTEEHTAPRQPQAQSWQQTQSWQYPPYQQTYWPQGTAQQAQAAAPPPPRKGKAGKRLLTVLVVLALVFGGVAGGLQFYKSRHGTSDPSVNPGTTSATKDNSRLELASTPDGDKSVAETPGTLTPVEIHKKLKNANVAVQIYSGIRTDSVEGEGSGVLIHEDSTRTYTYVVTCAHVIDSNQRVSVELEDGASYDAEIVGFDSRTDVGLLRVKATGLEGAEFGDSDMLKVGEPIYAIGNPGGVEFKGSFTNGMVSAIDRAITSKYKMKTIQHTAAINPGNSGGALVNTLGQVVGVNSQKIVDTEYEGMGFAIPSKTVQEVVNNLIAKGYVPNRPKLGIQYLPATQTQAGNWVVRSNSLPSGSLIIAKIDEGSDIQGTQVRTNDIITHVNGNPLNKPDVLLQAVENGKVGDELKLTIARVNSNYTVESFNVSVKLMEDKGTVTEPETQPWFYDEFGAQSGW